MHTKRLLFLHFICCSILQAGSSSSALPDWSIALQDKIIMPCILSQRIESSPGAIAIAYHPLLNTLSTCRFKPAICTGDGIGTVETHAPDKQWPIKTTHFHDDYIHLAAADDKGDVVVIGATRGHVRVHRLTKGTPTHISTDAEPLVKIRVKDPMYSIKACAIIPSATALALCAQHRQTGKNYFVVAKSVANESDRIIRTITSESMGCSVTAFALSGDGRSLAYATENGYVTILDMHIRFFDPTFKGTKHTSRRFKYALPIMTLAWSPDKRWLAASMLSQSTDDRFAFISAHHGEIMYSKRVSTLITACTFIDDNKLALCSEDKITTHLLNRLKASQIEYVLNALTPAARTLCQKTAACEGPYILAPDEIAIYEALPPLLHRPELFALPTTTTH